MLRLLAVVLIIMAGASGALAAEPVFPLTLQGWVAGGQDAFLTYAKLDDRRVPSPGTEAKWAVPTGLLTVRDVGPTDPTACP